MTLRHSRRNPTSLPGLACVLALVGTGCWGSDPVAVGPTARVARGRIERIVVATGTIEPEKEIQVRPRISGIVQVVHVKVGERVKQGDPLAQIDRELLEAQAKETRARREGSRVELHYANTNLKRAAALRKGGVLAQQQHEQAQARYQGALAAVARDDASVEFLEVQLAHTIVTAPMAAKVLAVDVEVGDAVSAVTSVTGGTRLLTLAVADLLHLEGLVDENEVARVAVGQPARIRTEAYADKVFEGRVREIAPIGKREQNVTYFEVEVEISDPEAGLLKPRMSGDAEIVTEVVEDAILVPETALLYEGDVIYVEVIGPNHSGDSGEFQRKNVTIGIVDSNRVQILSGLSPGEEVRLK